MAAAENHKGFPWLAGGVCCRRWVPSPALQLPQQPDARRASLTVVPGSHPARLACGGQAPPSPTSPQECPNSGAHRGAEGRVRAGMLHWLSTLMGGLIITDQDPVLQTRTLRQSQALSGTRGSSREAARPAGRRAACAWVACGQYVAGAELPNQAPRGDPPSAAPVASLSSCRAGLSPSTLTSGGPSIPPARGCAHLRSSPRQSLPVGSCPWPRPRHLAFP